MRERKPQDQLKQFRLIIHYKNGTSSKTHHFKTELARSKAKYRYEQLPVVSYVEIG